MNRRGFLGMLAGAAVARPSGASQHDFSWRTIPNQLVEIGVWSGCDGHGKRWVSTTLGRCYPIGSDYDQIDCTLMTHEASYRHDRRDDAAKERARVRFLRGLQFGETA